MWKVFYSHEYQSFVLYKTDWTGFPIRSVLVKAITCT